ncbi:hypothetical protein BDF14DRAFT_1187496 [Spinellus fusiger]|nr:hypothetical protein BDF14DRAFT_1187496 [Spinellus fusiger]
MPPPFKSFITTVSLLAWALLCLIFSSFACRLFMSNRFYFMLNIVNDRLDFKHFGSIGKRRRMSKVAVRIFCSRCRLCTVQAQFACQIHLSCSVLKLLQKRSTSSIKGNIDGFSRINTYKMPYS